VNLETKNDRQKQINHAKRMLGDWIKDLTDDLELLKENADVRGEEQMISDAIRNLFRLLLEFADQFAESVHKLMNPPKPPRTLMIRSKLKNKQRAEESEDQM
jgi:hypothetical protein